MRTDTPVSHQFDAFELESKGYRDFYKIELRDTAGSVLYLSPYEETQWLGQTWESIPCKLSDFAQNSTGEQSRPKFAVANPNGIFSLWIERGALDGALLTRYQVLLSDYDAGVSAYAKRIWNVSKVLSLNHNMVTVELRSTLDGANFILPARCYYPPDFPHVSLA
jgi:phage-related protein